MIRAATTLILLLLTAEAGPETIDVRERGAVDLASFECRDINRSSIIQRVCYDRALGNMSSASTAFTINIAMCLASIFDGLMGAPSMGSSSSGKSGIRVSRPLRLPNPSSPVLIHRSR